MSWINIHLVCKKCGKEFTKSKDCKSYNDERSFEKWAYENVRLCENCYEETKRMEYRKYRQEHAPKFTLCKLYGSEKQVSWAEKIRYSAVQTAQREVGELPPYFQTMLDHAKDAKWWIDRRLEFTDGYMVCRRLEKHMKTHEPEKYDVEIALYKKKILDKYPMPAIVGKNYSETSRAEIIRNDILYIVLSQPQNVDRVLEQIKTLTSAEWWIENEVRWNSKEAIYDKGYYGEIKMFMSVLLETVK